ncbi:MAG TPA: GNAT family N-acetyltransferase [Thermoplasmata archaeon]|nr:GNAT family N-acetyltransferase [Thermoplasmata archaeon]
MTEPPVGVRIVRATPQDVDRLVPLFGAYREFYRRPADPAGSRSFLRERLTRGESVIFVADDAGTTLGFAQLYPTFASLSMKRWWVLYDLFVIPAARRKGVASLLLTEARKLAQDSGAAGLSLETARDNPARFLYEARGWTQDDVFLHYELYV